MTTYTWTADNEHYGWTASDFLPDAGFG